MSTPNQPQRIVTPPMVDCAEYVVFIDEQGTESELIPLRVGEQAATHGLSLLPGPDWPAALPKSFRSVDKWVSGTSTKYLSPRDRCVVLVTPLRPAGTSHTGAWVPHGSSAHESGATP